MNETGSVSVGSIVKNRFNRDKFKELAWTGTFDEYVEIARKNPKIYQSAYQRLYNLIIAAGTEEVTKNKEKLIHYKFFDDVGFNQHPIMGLDKFLMDLVDRIKAAADKFGVERRILLLHGPVGSSKSTICSLLKRRLETYSTTPDGAIYSFSWKDVEGNVTVPCPINEDPLYLLPIDVRNDIVAELKINYQFEGGLCPQCQFYYDSLMEKYEGDWSQLIKHIEVRRIILSEAKRIGIATFQPKDEKNQDSTELTGDINYRKIAEYGCDSDPRAFNFDGEFQVANRGFFELIEMLKLQTEFLYDLLGAAQEHQIKPRKFAQMHLDTVLVGHTNSAEFLRLEKDETMEALRDRTIRVDIPYLLEWNDEIKVLKYFYNAKTVPQHIAPHTLEMAALWAILTRLKEPKKQGLSYVDKAKLYNGQTLPNYTEDNVRELRESHPDEGMDGISARFVMNAVSNALVYPNRKCINPFMVLNELEEGIARTSAAKNEDQRKLLLEKLEAVKQEFDEVIKNEIQRALIGDQQAIERLCTNYIDNIVAYVNSQKVQNPYTGRDEAPNQRLMQSVEEKIGISGTQSDDFRRQIVSMIGTLANRGKKFNYQSNAQLESALQLKLFEDVKDSIKLSALSQGATVVDPDLQEKIDALKERMKKQFGYCNQCAEDVLQYASSIFARGDLEKEKS